MGRYQSAATTSVHPPSASSSPSPAVLFAQSQFSMSSGVDSRCRGSTATNSSSNDNALAFEVSEPLDYEHFVEQQQAEVQSDELRELLLFPSDDVDAAIIQRRYRTVRPLAPDKAQIERLEPHVQECVRQYLSDFVYAHRRYSELGAWGVRQMVCAADGDTTVGVVRRLSSDMLHVYEVDGTAAASQVLSPSATLPNHALGNAAQGYCSPSLSATTTGSLRDSWLLSPTSSCLSTSSAAAASAGSPLCHSALMRSSSPSLSPVPPPSGGRGRRAGGNWPMSSHFDLKNSPADLLLPGLLDKLAADPAGDQLMASCRQHQQHQLHRPTQLLALCIPSAAAASMVGTQQAADLDVDESDEAARAEHVEKRLLPPLPCEHRGSRILVKCLRLKLELEFEPIFASMALYDAGRRRKISENFYFDMNSPQIQTMLREHVAHVDASTLARSCVFDISFPSADIFLVVKLEKVLQGDISDSVEPYIKDDKCREKAQLAARQYCQRLGQYRMPFAWTAVYLMNIVNGVNSLDRGGGGGGGSTTSSVTGDASPCVAAESHSSHVNLERRTSQSGFDQLRRRVVAAASGGDSSASIAAATSAGAANGGGDLHTSLRSFRPVTLTVSSFFKQEADKLRDEDLYKHLNELKRPGSAMKKLKCIGGSLKLDICPAGDDIKCCLTPELARVRPYPDEQTRPCKEVLEFPCESINEPHYLYRNLMFVTLKTVNFTNFPNKPGVSARNIAVKLQFMSGESSCSALPVIFGRSSCPELVSYAYSTVIYHNRAPDLSDEFKISLPANLSGSHHILFTFYHVSCQRKTEQLNVETPIGYTWLPVMREGRLNTGDACLPVLLDPPPANYCYITPDINLPGVRWVDGHRPLLALSVTAHSSVYPQDRCVDNFLCICRVIDTGVVPPRIGENNIESELLHCVEQLGECGREALVRFLPLLLDRLLLLLVRPPIVAGKLINAGPACFLTAGRLVDKLTSLSSSVNDLHGRSDLLMSYVKYQCTLPNMSLDYPVYNGSPVLSSLCLKRTPSLPRHRYFNRSSSNPNMAAAAAAGGSSSALAGSAVNGAAVNGVLPADADSEVGHILGRTVDRTASLRTGGSQEPMLTSPRRSPCRKLTHEELVLQWVFSSGRARQLAMDNAWFFFELIAKSMMCQLASSSSSSVGTDARRCRFPDRFCDDITALVNSATNEIISRLTQRIADLHNQRVNNLNAALAFFINDLLSVMDRGYVLCLVRNYCRQMSAQIAASASYSCSLLHLTLDFLRIVCSHEHYFAINLPFHTPFSSGCAGDLAASPTPSVGSTSSHCSFMSGTMTTVSERSAMASTSLAARCAELNASLCQQHYLSSMVLRLVDYCLTHNSDDSVHSKSVRLLLCLLTWHDCDPRYQSAAARCRVALLYLPLISLVLRSLHKLHHPHTPTRSSRAAADSGNRSPPASDGLASPSTTSSPLVTSVNQQTGCVVSSSSTRQLLLCVLWVLKNVRADLLRAVWCDYGPSRLSMLLKLLQLCISCFEYKGGEEAMRNGSSAAGERDTLRVRRRRLERLLVQGHGSARCELMRRRTSSPDGTPTGGVGSGDRLRWRKEVTASAAHWRHMAERQRTGADECAEEDSDEAAAAGTLEGLISGEAALVALDALETLSHVVLDSGGGSNGGDQLASGVVGGVFRVLLHALSCCQSVATLAATLAVQRWLVLRCPALLFDDSSEHCADLCLRLLSHCSSGVSTVRSHAAASLYLLMRQNFEIGNNFARVKMQVTMSLSSLVGTSSCFNEESLRRSLKTILEYAASDHELHETNFPGQVNDLVFNLHMILSDTVKMKEVQEDHELLLDLMYRIAKGYQNSPDLRLTWLDNMARKHRERGQHSEAGMCYLHSAALVAEYLAMLEPSECLPDGAVGFQHISPNILEESAVSDDVVSPDEDGVCTGRQFSESGLLQLLETAVECLSHAALHEVAGRVFQLITPIVEQRRDYRHLAAIYAKLHEIYDRVATADGRRLFWCFYRVGFYGYKFGDLNNEEFIYKEPALTKLSEISNRLEGFYSERFGAASVQIIKASQPFDPGQLNPDVAYIQITFVEPHFDLWESRHKHTPFEHNFNIRDFMFATPYTLDGRAHGELHEQYKRKTMLTTSHCFPYIKTRIPVIARREIILTPIEVAIEDLRKKTGELSAAVQQTPPDTKILQMVLQGCIGTTVNQGPLEVANVFLNDLFVPSKHEPTGFQKKLRICFKDFCKKCLDALRKNRTLIKSDQHEYQRELEKNYQRFVERLKPLLSHQQAHNLTLSKSGSRSRDLLTTSSSSSQHQHHKQHQHYQRQQQQQHLSASDGLL